MFDDFYFVARDGRVYATERREVVDEGDTVFEEWLAAGNIAGHWPRDENNDQTIASLQDALISHKVWIEPAAYAAERRWQEEETEISVTIGGETVPASTRRDIRDGYRDTLLAILSGLRADGMTFKFADGVPRPATNAEMLDAIGAVFAHVQAAFETEREVREAIAAETITTVDAVDTAFEDAAQQ